MTVRRLYELQGANDLRFSPYCWRTRLALAHKGLDAEYVPVRFGEKDKIAFSGQQKVPVLDDSGHVVADSFAIAKDLETRYPKAPSLFGGVGGVTSTYFFNTWCDRVVHPAISPMIIADLFGNVDPRDHAYFRKDREAKMGRRIEDVQVGREAKLPVFRAVLDPVRFVLDKQPYIAGDEPAYADHILFGTLMWPRCVSTFELLDPADRVWSWRERMLDFYGGLGRTAKVPAAA